MTTDPFRDLSTDELLAQVATAEADWSRRHAVIRDWRDLRYGRDDVLGGIPDELQATDFEYHSPELDEAIFDLTSFVSASDQTFTVDPPSAKQQTKADDIESILEAVFGPLGILEREAGESQAYRVWEHQVESGHGLYKFHLKRDYPLRYPQVNYVDELEGMDASDFEPNPDFSPRSRKADRSEKGTTRHRETQKSLRKRREDFSAQEFAWQWRAVDPATIIPIFQDSQPVAFVEISQRPVTVLSEHGRHDLMDGKDFVFLGEPYPTTGTVAKSEAQMVTTFELWSTTRRWYGFLSSTRDNQHRRQATLADGDSKVRPHPYGRPPYFSAYGLPGTDPDRGYRWVGAFGRLIQELPLLNNLETLHTNAVWRGHLPLYYPVKDTTSSDVAALDNMDALIGVSQADLPNQQLPPGWKWEVMPTGFEPDLMAQLTASRERVKESAIAAVLKGASPGAGDSGAKISLLINAASRALSPFVRHHEAPLTDMAETFLRTNFLLGLDTDIQIQQANESGDLVTRRRRLPSKDIVSTSVRVKLDMALPLDKAAMEVRGITLIDSGKRSYESAAPEFFGVGDPRREKDRIMLEKREGQIDELAFQAALEDFQVDRASQRGGGADVPQIEDTGGTVGGGPAGAFGGAAAEAGRGGAARTTSTQVDTGGNGAAPGA